MTDPAQKQRTGDLIVSGEGRQNAHINYKAEQPGIILDVIGYGGREPKTILKLTESPSLLAADVGTVSQCEGDHP